MQAEREEGERYFQHMQKLIDQDAAEERKSRCPARPPPRATDGSRFNEQQNNR